MEEEKKVEEVQEEKVEQAPANDNDKNVLTAFILFAVAVVLAFSWWVGAIGGVVCGVLSMNMINKTTDTTKKPHNVFQKITRIGSKIVIPVAGVMFVLYLVLWIVALCR